MLLAVGDAVATALGTVPGVAALLLVGGRGRRWPEVLGVVAGLGSGAVLLGASLLGDPSTGDAGAIAWIAGGVAGALASIVVYGLALSRAAQERAGVLPA
jgi:hypothetical protein